MTGRRQQARSPPKVAMWSASRHPYATRNEPAESTPKVDQGWSGRRFRQEAGESASELEALVPI